MTFEAITEVMRKSVLFRNLTENELMEILKDINTKVEVYEKNTIIFGENERPKRLFILLSGQVGILKSTYAGKRILIHHTDEPGEIFGEIYLFMEKEQYEIQAEVLSKTTLLELKNDIFFQNHDEKRNRIEEQLRNNMLKLFAMKAYQMNRKVRILGCTSIREKIAVYLLDRQQGSQTVLPVPGREELADYLNITRPSLSRELMKMSAENLIRAEGRRIEILNQEALEEYL